MSIHAAAYLLPTSSNECVSLLKVNNLGNYITILLLFYYYFITISLLFYFTIINDLITIYSITM